MLDLRTALEDAHSIIASIDDDCGDEGAPEGGVPDLELRCSLVDAEGNTCEVFPPFSGVRLEPGDGNTCRVALRRPGGLVEAGRLEDGGRDDFEEAVALLLLAQDLGMPAGTDAPTLEELRSFARQGRPCPLLVKEARAARSQTILWDSSWTLGLDEREAGELERSAADSLRGALSKVPGTIVVSTLSTGGDLAFFYSSPADLPLVGGDVIVMDDADELVVRRPGSTDVARISDRPISMIARASQTELGVLWRDAHRVCAPHRLEEARYARQRQESLRETSGRLCPAPAASPHVPERAEQR